MNVKITNQYNKDKICLICIFCLYIYKQLKYFYYGAVALSGSLFAKKNKSRASQSPALGVRFKYEQKQNLTERLYLIFSVLSNQTSTGS